MLLRLPGAGLRLALGGRSRLPGWDRRVLLASAALVAAGNAALYRLPLPGDALDVVFQSLTARTAGFASFPQTALGPTALAIVVALMVIGAAPMSTGGGIKVTTLTLLVEPWWRRSVRRSRPARSLAGKLAVIALMIFGRVGLLSMLLAWVLPSLRGRAGEGEEGVARAEPDVLVG